jgi:nicotinamidase-related amidase
MKQALVVIDCQNDFIKPDGKLPVPNAENIIPNVVKLIEKAGQMGWQVIYTTDDHSEDDLEFKLFPEHCVNGTPGNNIIDPVIEAINKVIEKQGACNLSKNTVSLWDSNKSAGETFKDITDVIVCGVATDYCVSAFCKGARQRKIGVELVVDAIAGVDEIPNVPNTKGKVAETLLELGEMSVCPVFTSDIVSLDNPQ